MDEDILINVGASSECINVPNTDISIYPGNKVQLGRFDTTVWTVQFGWFSYAGNRPFCGWFLTDEKNKETKPLQLPDLDDIYIVEY